MYSKIIKLGCRPKYSEVKNKRISLLNTYVLIWIHFIFLGAFADYFLGLLTVNVFLLYLVTILSMIVIVALNYKGYYKKIRLFFIILAFVNITSLSLFLGTGYHIENYFIAISCISLSLYTKNYIPLACLLLSLILYFVPFYWYPVYPQEVIDSIDPPSVVFLFTTIYLMVNYFKKYNLRSELKLKVAYDKLEKVKKSELAHLQLKSLKAQMNPHFMFNAMNSIQNLVLKGDKHEAYQYLSKFSNLIRENLYMSEKSFVSFDEELSLLKKYLELEKLRFRDDFKYELIGEEINENLKIPSMIIQPFIENAIKHGLLHKINTVKYLTIEFVVADVLKCIITDNGIGIKKSLEINKQNDNKSFSTNAIHQRLEFLRDYYKSDIGFKYIDIEEGTQVEIKIPYLK